MKNKIKIAVLMGGPSSEHEISLKTGRMILKTLNKKKYFVRPVVVAKKGKWPISFRDLKKNFDLAFIAMHGEYGEDGAVQRILERFDIPYTGSDSSASRLGMDKIKSAALFEKAGLSVPKIGIRNFPMVIKPSDRGSSVGVSIVKSREELKNAIALARQHSSKVMWQEFIEGRELTCGVLELNGRVKALPPTEIITRGSRFFDYRAKYKKGASREVTPPNLSEKIIKKIQRVALKAHQVIGVRGFSRTDMILKNSKLYILEINTIPGMTETSLLPQQAKAAGIGFSELLDIIIMSACKKSKKQN